MVNTVWVKIHLTIISLFKFSFAYLSNECSVYGDAFAWAEVHGDSRIDL